MRDNAVHITDRIKRTIHTCRRAMDFACYYTRCCLAINLKKGVEPVIMFETPSHGNIGDHAIAYAEELLVRRSQRNFWIEIPDRFISGRFFTPSKWSGLVRDHKVFVVGGGFVGTLWINSDMAVRKILKAYRDHEIVFFPQTVYFDDKSEGLINEYRELFRRCRKVTFMVREKSSYQRMLQYNFPNVTVKLMPDMVTYLKPSDFVKLEKHTHNPKKALLCMRKDHERVLTDSQRARIDEALSGYEVDETDTVVPYRISSRTRKREIEKKLAEFADADLIVTDRLHGMLLAAIAQTPCVAFNNCSDKVRGLYEWIKENRYIQFIDDIDDLETKIAEVTGQPDRTYHNEHLQSYFEELAEYL